MVVMIKYQKKLNINTLDAFQGRENDIIIYSTVRTKNSIGFKKKRKELMLLFQELKICL